MRSALTLAAFAALYLIGTWAVITGVIELISAGRRHVRAGRRALLALTGLVSVGVGLALFARPDMGTGALLVLLIVQAGVIALRVWGDVTPTA